MISVLNNWMTTTAGMPPFVIGVFHIVTAIMNKQVPDGTDIGLVFAGIMGFISKDFNTTGTGATATKP